MENNNNQIKESILQTIRSMMFKRGYIEKDTNETTLTFISENDTIFVYFYDKIDMKLLTTIKEKCILVVEKDLSSTLKGYIREHKLPIEMFKESELLFDITNHVLVPKHERLTNIEKEQFYKRYNINDSQVPRMSLEDPIARFYGAKKGDIFKITRPSETMASYTTYRIVY